ncbi:hypothetical protein ACHAW6_001726 [Cyclotella cf. meneghiniana]
MWPSHDHILEPLTNHSVLKTHALIPWTSDMQTPFDKMSMLMAADALTAYPDHNKQFDVHTNASDYQLLAKFSRKLLKSQQNHMVMEKEMLSIVATLNEF